MPGATEIRRVEERDPASNGKRGAGDVGSREKLYPTLPYARTF